MNANDLKSTITLLGQNARKASRYVAKAPTAAKNAALRFAAQEIRHHIDEILKANQQDLDKALQQGLEQSFN